jgi:hypothetical protein
MFHHSLSVWKTGQIPEKIYEFGSGESLITWSRISLEMASLSDAVKLKLVTDWKKAIRKKQEVAGIRLADEKEARPHDDQKDCEEEFLNWDGRDSDGDSAEEDGE